MLKRPQPGDIVQEVPSYQKRYTFPSFKGNIGRVAETKPVEQDLFDIHQNGVRGDKYTVEWICGPDGTDLIGLRPFMKTLVRQYNLRKLLKKELIILRMKAVI